MPEVVAVNVVHRIRPGKHGDTAIDKRPVDGPVEVTELGLDGDTQCDRRYHGGPDKALYAYALEDNRWWSQRLDRDIPPGTFGENLTISGLDVNAAEIGETWQIGDVVVEVRCPRTPCTNLAHRMGMPRFNQRFRRTGRVGAYLKVCQVGSIRAGAPVNVRSRPGHGVTIAQWSAPTAELAKILLQAKDLELADEIREQAERVVARAVRSSRAGSKGRTAPRPG